MSRAALALALLVACSPVASEDRVDATLSPSDAPLACTGDDTCPTGFGCDPALGCVARYGRSADRPGTSCLDVLRVLGTTPDGAYWIDPDGGAADNSFQVHCDMTTDGGGWTLVYKYAGIAAVSQTALLAREFAGDVTTHAPLAADRVDAINRRALDAFWMARGRSWMSVWTLYDKADGREQDRNFAVFDLDNQVAWSDVYAFTPGCAQLPGAVTVKVHDDVTRQLVTVGSSSYRFVANADGRGFLAADTTQASYASTCEQLAANVLTWPAGLLFDSTLNVSWHNTIAHLWYSRAAEGLNKDRCAWKCWADDLQYSGREWYVR